MGIAQDDRYGGPQAIPAGLHAEFITEHYWGLHRVPERLQRVSRRTSRRKLQCHQLPNSQRYVATLYGERFAETLSQSPRSAFIARTAHRLPFIRSGIVGRLLSPKRMAKRFPLRSFRDRSRDSPERRMWANYSCLENKAVAPLTKRG